MRSYLTAQNLFRTISNTLATAAIECPGTDENLMTVRRARVWCFSQNVGTVASRTNHNKIPTPFLNHEICLHGAAGVSPIVYSGHCSHQLGCVKATEGRAAVLDTRAPD